MFSENYFSNDFIGDDSKEDTPVPIPNTVVKLFNGENSVKAKIASCQFFFAFKYINYIIDKSVYYYLNVNKFIINLFLLK